MVVAAALAASLATDGVRGLKRLRLPMGLGILGLTALPWLLPYLLQREKSYGRAVVMTDYLGWYFKSAAGSRLQAIAAHLLRFLPWGIFLVPAASFSPPRRGSAVSWPVPSSSERRSGSGSSSAAATGSRRPRGSPPGSASPSR